jgi:hypothetical protein
MGSPFLTFSYKAFPVAIRSAISQPIKFAEYLTLPVLLTMLSAAMNDWDDDDLDKFKRAMSDYQRTNPMMTFLPFKDDKGNPQILDLSYIAPWSQTFTAARKIYENFVEDQGVSPTATTLKSIGTVVNEFGFMGGPIPTMIAAAQTGKDPFTDRSIGTPGASADQQLFDYMKFGWDLAVPAWISSHGWVKKLAQEFNGTPEKDRDGNVKFTPFQVAGEVVGFPYKSLNVDTGLKNRKVGFDMQLKELATYKSKIVHDKNLNFAEKQEKLKDITFRTKLLRQRASEETAQ